MCVNEYTSNSILLEISIRNNKCIELTIKYPNNIMAVITT
jgi:hypothetical protein